MKKSSHVSLPTPTLPLRISYVHYASRGTARAGDGENQPLVILMVAFGVLFRKKWEENCFFPITEQMKIELLMMNVRQTDEWNGFYCLTHDYACQPLPKLRVSLCL